MFLIGRGIAADSFTGSAAGIVTDDNFGDAEIIEVNPKNIEDSFAKNDVAVVAGFQGITQSGDITTLGRNGSDTTAVYMAYRFDAKSCVLYKDVNGVYEKNPKDNKNARLYKYLNHKELFDGNAAGIIHPRALKLVEDMFAVGRETEIIIRNIDMAERQFTTICHRKTEFYK
jgi:aspartate kinase